MDLLHVIYILYAVYAALFGIVIGSFLNVVIYRLPVGKTIARGHSMCMSCGHTLAAKDLIPLFSWLFLKGKCRYCGAPVASRYAKIESLTGVVFLIIALTHLDASLVFVDPSSTYFLGYQIISMLFTVSCCCMISAMMIWYDTGKTFLSLALFPLIVNMLTVIVRVFMSNKTATGRVVLKFFLWNTAYIAIFIAISVVIRLITRKGYKKPVFVSDLMTASVLTTGIFITDISLWYVNYPIMIAIVGFVSVICTLADVLTEGKNSNRYKLITASAVCLLFILVRFFISRAVYGI